MGPVMTVDQLLAALEAANATPEALTSILRFAALQRERGALQARIQETQDSARSAALEAQSRLQQLTLQLQALDLELANLLR